MDYSSLKPSLERTVLLRIALNLWDQADIKAICYTLSFNSQKQWRETVVSEVKNKVLKLPLPEPLKKNVSSFVEGVGIHIHLWKLYNKRFLDDEYVMNNLKRLRWTVQGTIDKRKTAEVLVRDRNLNRCSRFGIACTYCLENTIFALWNEYFLLPEAEGELSVVPLVQFWSHFMCARMVNLYNRMRDYCSDHHITRPYEYAFAISARDGNEVATEYFYQKLSSNLKKHTLLKTAQEIAPLCWGTRCCREYSSDVLIFLLSQMTNEQRTQVYKRNCFEILNCFLDWPRQILFTETLIANWVHLSEQKYYFLLQLVYERVSAGYQEYDYQTLFEESWRGSPVGYREYVRRNYTSSQFLLWKLLKIGDKNNVSLLLSDASVKEKEDILFCDSSKNMCRSLFRSCSWDIIMYFVKECVTSKRTIIKFKKVLVKCTAGSLFENSPRRIEMVKFFQLLDDLAQEFDRKEVNTEEFME